MKAVAVATAEEALEVLENSAIDILLTDLKLQQTNGVELLKQVHDVHPEVAVMVFPSNFTGAAGMTRGRTRSRANRWQMCGGERWRRGE
jgi:two-component SAPR family response regulator